jgi:hypothetical protein
MVEQRFRASSSIAYARGASAAAFEADLVHRVAEFQAVLGLVDGVGIGADHLDAVFLQRAIAEQRQRAC